MLRPNDAQDIFYFQTVQNISIHGDQSCEDYYGSLETGVQHLRYGTVATERSNLWRDIRPCSMRLIHNALMKTNDAISENKFTRIIEA